MNTLTHLNTVPANWIIIAAVLLVENYRAAQAIAVRDERGEADTEQLRKAVVHYRTLFDELLEVRSAKETAAPPRQVRVHS